MGALHFNLELKTHEWKFISAWLNTSMCYGCRSNAVLAHVLQIKDTITELEISCQIHDCTCNGKSQLVGRSLFRLGLLIRHGNSLLNTPNNKNIDVTSSLCLSKKYLLMDDFGIKVRSLKDLGKIVEATLSSGSHIRLKMKALQNMHEYLLDAESQMETDKTGNNAALHPVEGSNSVHVAAGAGDANICGGIVQLYWDRILGRCFDFHDQVRQTALKAITDTWLLIDEERLNFKYCGSSTTPGSLLHPITCVPYLIALETDPQELNSSLVDCLAATALQLLFKLKRHLKTVYSLNDSRCQAFSPTEPPKPGEPLSRQNIPFDINHACTGVPSKYQDLVQRYQEFKGALKEDTVDYSTYTANIKRKRLTPRKLKSGRMTGDDEDDYDGEDGAGGGRRQGSGRKDNSIRGGRHRR
ncbi:hypothetical protein Peur_052705 [Populus x canadensis]